MVIDVHHHVIFVTTGLPLVALRAGHASVFQPVRAEPLVLAEDDFHRYIAHCALRAEESGA
ncbi:hypothetical protein JY427_06215 [Stenotrophomonas maltophilia]|nr:hypothetical protein [Stenotrophomonas maltophilia]